MGKKKYIFRSRISVLLVAFVLAILMLGAIPTLPHKILYVHGGAAVFFAFLLCGMRYVMISPALEQEFIELLKSINPKIEVKVPIKKKEGVWRFWDWDI